MTSQEIEYWAFKVIESVTSKHRVEDSRIELKADWPEDYNKIARRIAGLANAAAGEPVMLVLGLSEESGATGVNSAIDLADWWPRVTSEFEMMHPRVKDLRIRAQDKELVILFFETDTAPYVVKNAAYGTTSTGVSLEVPWREGTSIRSARRADLLKLLVPKPRAPKIEIIRASFREKIGSYGELRIGYDSQLTLYVAPSDQDTVTFPMFKTDGYFEFESGRTAPITIRNFDVEKSEGVAQVTKTSSGLTFTGPGGFSMYVYARALPDIENISPSMRLVIRFFEAGSTLPVIATREFKSGLTKEQLLREIAKVAESKTESKAT